MFDRTRTAAADRVIYYTTVSSPIGPLLLTSDGTALTGLHMSPLPPRPATGDVIQDWDLADAAGTWVADAAAAPLRETAAQLAAYFAGRLTVFAVPLALHGTEFQRRVWTALQAIPYGTTISYGDLARRVGNPQGSRAVGLANGRNPVAIIVPCHRVIGAGGKLTGYGGGLPRKAALLDFEFGVRLHGPGVFPPLADLVPLPAAEPARAAAR
jgi:methylated-DNA-[protein]-cysteine S-methyltransferase